MMNTRKRITKLQIKMLRDPTLGFFGALLLKPEIVKNNKIQTVGIASDLSKIEYNPQFVDSVNDEGLQTVLTHEVMHLALQHPLRSQKFNNRFKANIAGDVEINSMLMRNSFQFPEGIDGVKPNYNGEIVFPAILFKNRDTDYIMRNCFDKTMEKAYRELPEFKDINNVSNIATPQFPEEAKNNEGQAIEENTREKMREWKSAVEDAKTVMKERGELPGGVRRILDEIFNPKLPWYRILSKYMTKTLNTTQTWRKPSRRSQALGFYLPSYKKDGLEVDVWIDTSGSVSKDEIKSFLGEVSGILDVHPRTIGEIHFWHTKVYHTMKMKDFNKKSKLQIEYGGTTLKCIDEYLKKKNKIPHLSIIYTDGYVESSTKKLISKNLLFVIPEKRGITRLVERIGPTILREDI